MSTASFSTPLSRRLGLKYPLVLAPMFIISNREMIVAAARAGVLGSMPSLNAREHSKLREDLAWIRERTDKPFAINLTIGLTERERLEADFAACLEFEVPVLITSYGNPTPLVQAAKPRGTIIFHDVINLRHAKKAEAAGVDAIIGVSAGAGGHAGRITPFALFPWLRDELSVPIIGAGSISTGQQVAATLALGAELCYMGTRFIASKECGAQPEYKQMIVDSGPEDIVYTDEVSGTHANFIRQTLPSQTDTGIRGGEAKRWKDIWSAGHGVAQVDSVQSVEQIVDDVVREFHDTVGRLSAL